MEGAEQVRYVVRVLGFSVRSQVRRPPFAKFSNAVTHQVAFVLSSTEGQIDIVCPSVSRVNAAVAYRVLKRSTLHPAHLANPVDRSNNNNKQFISCKSSTMTKNGISQGKNSGHVTTVKSDRKSKPSRRKGVR
jgi:hypothetical protein